MWGTLLGVAIIAISVDRFGWINRRQDLRGRVLRTDFVNAVTRAVKTCSYAHSRLDPRLAMVYFIYQTIAQTDDQHAKTHERLSGSWSSCCLPMSPTTPGDSTQRQPQIIVLAGSGIRRLPHDALHPRSRARRPDVVHPAAGPRQRAQDARRLRRAAQQGLRGRVRRGTASRRGRRTRACAPTDRAVPRAPAHRVPDTHAPPPPRHTPRTPHQVPAGTRAHTHRVRDQLTGARARHARAGLGRTPRASGHTGRTDDEGEPAAAGRVVGREGGGGRGALRGVVPA